MDDYWQYTYGYLVNVDGELRHYINDNGAYYLESEGILDRYIRCVECGGFIPIGEITKSCAILVRRHIHITKEDKEKYNLPDIISVKVDGERGAILNDVYVKVSDEAYLEMHIDTDEANALGLKNNDEVEII